MSSQLATNPCAKLTRRFHARILPATDKRLSTSDNSRRWAILVESISRFPLCSTFRLALHLCRHYFIWRRDVHAFDARATESSLSCRQNTSSPPSTEDNIRVSLQGSEARTQKLRGKKAFSRIGLSRCKKALSHRSRSGTAVMNDNAVFPQKYVHRGAYPRPVLRARLVASTLIYSAASRRISDIWRFLFTTFAARCKNFVRKITSLCSSCWGC